MPETKSCPKCNKTFECCAKDAGADCWCGQIDYKVKPDYSTDCLCSECLKTLRVE